MGSPDGFCSRYHRQVLHAKRVEPCPLLRWVPEVELAHLDDPPSIDAACPDVRERFGQTKRQPCRGKRRVLKNAAKLPHGFQGKREAPVIVAFLVAVPGFDEPGELAPTGARRMRDNWPRAWVLPSVARRGPGVHVFHVGIWSVLFDEQGGYHVGFGGCNNGVRLEDAHIWGVVRLSRRAKW